MTSTGFCPHCQQNVLMRREDMNVVLAILLFCCTGIGFFIYLIFYYSKPKDRCVHCNSICQTILSSITPQAAQQLPYQTQPTTQNVHMGENYVKFCPLCGNQLDEESKNFCPSCGSKL